VGFRDQFYAPETAKAVFGWPILLGIGVAAGSILLGFPETISMGVGVLAYRASIVAKRDHGLDETWQIARRSHHLDQAGRRLDQTRLDELVALAAQASTGASDTDARKHDVEYLVVELEGLRQAVQETRIT
jgi:hypothetical protein